MSTCSFSVFTISEAFFVHLNSQHVNIKGLALPFANVRVASEFTNDTTLYVHASQFNLLRVQKAMDDFSD